MTVFTIDHSQTEVRIAGFGSLEEATATMCPDGFSRNMVRECEEMGQLSEDVLLRAYNFKKTGKAKPAITGEKDRRKVEAALWALLQHKADGNATGEKDLTSVAEDGKGGAQEAGSSAVQPQADGLSPETKEADMPGKRKSTKKARAAKAKTKAKRTTKAAGGPRGEKTLEVSRLLQRKSGCTRKDILEATGWTAVSVQQMAKACGLKLKQEKEKGKPTVYFGTAA